MWTFTSDKVLYAIVSYQKKDKVLYECQGVKRGKKALKNVTTENKFSFSFYRNIWIADLHQPHQTNAPSNH